MEIIDVLMRQQQIAMEKGKEASALKERAYYQYLLDEVRTFLRETKPTRRLILIPGLRGIGKTTILLQFYHLLLTEQKLNGKQVFYLSLDELNSFGITLKDAILTIEKDILKKPLALIKEKLVFVFDEVHYSKNWSLELKLIYDQGYDILVVASGSSSIKMKESADLARRRMLKPMFPLSFLEYLTILGNPQIPALDIRTLLSDPEKCAVLLEQFYEKNSNLIEKVRANGLLDEYLIYGGFPFQKQEAIEKMQDLISKIIHKDIEESIEDVNSLMVEKLVNYLAISKTGETSIEKASQKLGISKPSILKYLDYLEKAELLFAVRPFSPSSKAVRASTKYYFASSSLKAAILYKLLMNIERADVVGELLESAVFSSLRNWLQVSGVACQIYYDSNASDFILKFADGRTIALEVKKGNESSLQIKESMKHAGAEFGIVVSANRNIKYRDKVLYVPKELFLMLL